MSIPYFPMYPADFEADTSHLSMAEDGAYNRLLRLMWMTPGCTLPDDDAWLRRRMRATEQEFEAVVRPVLEEFFVRKNGRIVSLRLNEWAARAQAAQPRPWVPLDVQRAVRDRDGDACAYCGSREGPFHLDHVMPWSRGGRSTVENMTVACAPCNWSKGSKTPEEWRQ